MCISIIRKHQATESNREEREAESSHPPTKPKTYIIRCCHTNLVKYEFIFLVLILLLIPASLRSLAMCSNPLTIAYSAWFASLIAPVSFFYYISSPIKISLVFKVKIWVVFLYHSIIFPHGLRLVQAFPLQENLSLVVPLWEWCVNAVVFIMIACQYQSH